MQTYANFLTAKNQVYLNSADCGKLPVTPYRTGFEPASLLKNIF